MLIVSAKIMLQINTLKDLLESRYKRAVFQTVKSLDCHQQLID